MKTIKKTFLSARSFFVASVITPMLLKTAETHAAVYGGGGIAEGINDASGLGGIATTTSISQLIIKVITFILDIVLLLAVAAIILAGIYLIISNGEEGEKDKAKRVIYYAIIGIVVVLMSRVIVIAVNTLLS